MRREAERRRIFQRYNVERAGYMVDQQGKRKKQNYMRYLKRLTELYNERQEAKMEDKTRLVWTAEMVDRLVGLVDRQMSPREIAQEMGLPEDKVKWKLMNMKAKTTADKRERFTLSTNEEPDTQTQAPTEAQHEAESATPEEPAQATALPIDRVVYYSLDEAILRLQADGEEPALYFRRALELLDLWTEGLREQIERTPAAMTHWASIGAIVAYQELTGKEVTKNARDDDR